MSLVVPTQRMVVSVNQNAMRYVEPGQPMMSRLLTHPLASAGGGDYFHGGPRRWATTDDPEWQMLAAWVRGGTPECVVGRGNR